MGYYHQRQGGTKIKIKEDPTLHPFDRTPTHPLGYSSPWRHRYSATHVYAPTCRYRHVDVSRTSRAQCPNTSVVRSPRSLVTSTIRCNTKSLCPPHSLPTVAH